MLYITRHGETVLNKQRRWQGSVDGSLTHTGKAQAGKVGRFLCNKGIEYIISSPLGRCVETTNVIKLFLAREPTVLYDQRLCERSLGIIEGLTTLEATEKLNELYTTLISSDTFTESQHPFAYLSSAPYRSFKFFDEFYSENPLTRWSAVPPLGETLINLYDRSYKFLQDYMELFNRTTVLVVTHSFTSTMLRYILSAFSTETNPEYFFALPKHNHGDVFAFISPGEEIICHSTVQPM